MYFYTGLLRELVMLSSSWYIYMIYLPYLVYQQLGVISGQVQKEFLTFSCPGVVKQIMLVTEGTIVHDSRSHNTWTSFITGADAGGHVSPLDPGYKKKIIDPIPLHY